MGYNHIKIPENGSAIRIENSRLDVPDYPVIPFIEGDGAGVDIWTASVKVLDAAVKNVYKNKRKISWMEVYAGDKANAIYGEEIWLPEDTIKAFQEYLVGIKGPVNSPQQDGVNSVNSKLRKTLDLYANIKPVIYYHGLPSPVKIPEEINITIVRNENEDIYGSLEFDQNSQGVEKIREILKTSGLFDDVKFSQTASFGIRAVSREGTERLVRAAIHYAIIHGLPSVTIVHRGNIQKHTDGNFVKWGYDLAKKEFAEKVVTWDDCGGNAPPGTILIRDVLADNFLQQLITSPGKYNVVATLNQNGDNIFAVLAAQAGGAGIIPGGYINYESGHALFEASHGTFPKFAGFDKANPASLILSGAMMLDYIGWKEAAVLVQKSYAKTILNKTLTYDLARLIDGAREVKCSEFADMMISHMNEA